MFIGTEKYQARGLTVQAELARPVRGPRAWYFSVTVNKQLVSRLLPGCLWEKNYKSMFVLFTFTFTFFTALIFFALHYILYYDWQLISDGRRPMGFNLSLKTKFIIIALYYYIMIDSRAWYRIILTVFKTNQHRVFPVLTVCDVSTRQQNTIQDRCSLIIK